jgi:hypothetical protein
MGFWLVLFLYVASTVAGALLSRRPKAAQPAAIGDFTVPTAQEGRVVPVPLGTVKLTGANVLWYGDLKTQPLKKNAGLLGFGKTTQIGYKYWLGMHLGLCHGTVEFVGLYAGTHPDDKFVPCTVTFDAGTGTYTIRVDQKKLFGGEESEGGLFGTASLYNGGTLQNGDGYLGAKLALTPAPAYRGLCHMVLAQWYVGTSAYIKNLSVVVKRVTDVLGLSTRQLGYSGLCGAFTDSAGHVIQALEIGRGGAWVVPSGATKLSLGINDGNDYGNNTGTGWLVTVRQNGGAVWSGTVGPKVKPWEPSINPAYIFGDAGPSLAPVVAGLTLATGDLVTILCTGGDVNVGTGTVTDPLGYPPSGDDNLLGLYVPSHYTQRGNQNDIAGDMNPANMLYELMTNSAWGLNRPASLIDAGSFRVAGTTLTGEGFGLSMQLDTELSAEDLINEILRHIDAAMYTDPATGLWTIKLARADYDPATVPELTPLDGTKPEFTRGSWEETLNEIFITYTDRADFKQKSVKADESANYATRGEIASDTINFLGISNQPLAQQVAMRELKTHSYPLAKLKLKVSRKAWNYRIAGVFKFTWPAYGITGQIFRITAINYGALDSGQIEIEAVEDIFGVSKAAYSAPSASGWVDPLGNPVAPVAQGVTESPYHVTPGERRIIIAPVRGDDTCWGFEVWVDEGSGFYQVNAQTDGFSPSGLLVGAYSRKTSMVDNVGFILNSTRDLDTMISTSGGGLVRGDMLCMIDSEIMSVQTLTNNNDGTWTVTGIMRAVMDTLPADHAAGARVYFINQPLSFVYPNAMTVGDVTNLPVKCLPENPKGTVAIGAVTQVLATTNNRQAKPYPPGKVQINGVFEPTSVCNDQARLTFDHRNRVTQKNANALTAQSDTQGVSGVPAQAPEGNYTIELLLDGVVLGAYTVTATTVTGPYDYTYLNRWADSADGNKLVAWRITPVNGSLIGAIRTTSFRMSGLGMGLGLDFGGANA